MFNVLLQFLAKNGRDKFRAKVRFFFVDMHVHSGRSSASIMLVFMFMSYPKITEVDVATSEFFKDQQYIQPARIGGASAIP